MVGLIDKFMGFLLTYLENRPTDATMFIKECQGGAWQTLLIELLSNLPQLQGKSNLQLLCKTLSLDMSEGGGKQGEGGSSDGGGQSVPPTPPASSAVAATSTLANGMQFSQVCDILFKTSKTWFYKLPAAKTT